LESYIFLPEGGRCRQKEKHRKVSATKQTWDIDICLLLAILVSGQSWDIVLLKLYL